MQQKKKKAPEQLAFDGERKPDFEDEDDDSDEDDDDN